MKTEFFFKKVSAKVLSGGPSQEEQLLSIAKGRYWIVLNTHLLRDKVNDKVLRNRVNAFKQALQTFGPMSTNLPDFRQNEGKAKGFVFHGHVGNGNGTTYVLEWTVVNKEKQIMALLGFDTHENYKFQQTPLNKNELDMLLINGENTTILNRVPKKLDEAKNKLQRMGSYRP